MPAKSRKQQKFIFAKRDEYGSKENTPEKWKWIWEKDWEKIEEYLNAVDEIKMFNLYDEIKQNIKELSVNAFFHQQFKNIKYSDTIEDLATILATYSTKAPSKRAINNFEKELRKKFGNNIKKAKEYCFKKLTDRREKLMMSG